MATVSLPVAGRVIEVTLPDEHASFLARVLVATPLSRARVGERPINDPGAWGPSVVKRFVERAAAGGALFAKEVADHERHLAQYAWHSMHLWPDWLTVDALVGHLVFGGVAKPAGDDPIALERRRVIRRAVLVTIGHHAPHDHDECTVCLDLLGGRAGYALSVLGIPQVVIWDLYQAFLAACWMPEIRGANTVDPDLF